MGDGGYGQYQRMRKRYMPLLFLPVHLIRVGMLRVCFDRHVPTCMLYFQHLCRHTTMLKNSVFY